MSITCFPLGSGADNCSTTSGVSLIRGMFFLGLPIALKSRYRLQVGFRLFPQPFNDLARNPEILAANALRSREREFIALHQCIKFMGVDVKVCEQLLSI